jgi:hypothetical protein
MSSCASAASRISHFAFFLPSSKVSGLGGALDMKKADEWETPVWSILRDKEREKYPWEVPYTDIQLGDIIGKVSA